MARQLTLDLALEPALGRDDFLVTPANALALATLDNPETWPQGRMLLTGPDGSGKTHLAAIWAARAHAWTLSAAELDEAKVPHLASGGALVIEDCDAGRLDEAALFHLMNAIKARGGFLLLTARSAPDLWGLSVPDLLSRLRLAPAATIEPPDDGLLRALLVKLFIDRQLVVDIAVIDALAMRMERSFAAARQVVDRLDRLALERGRRVTRPLVQEALAELFPQDAG